jgi:hypothetical protein
MHFCLGCIQLRQETTRETWMWLITLKWALKNEGWTCRLDSTDSRVRPFVYIYIVNIVELIKAGSFLICGMSLCCSRRFCIMKSWRKLFTFLKPQILSQNTDAHNSRFFLQYPFRFISEICNYPAADISNSACNIFNFSGRRERKNTEVICPESDRI